MLDTITNIPPPTDLPPVTQDELNDILKRHTMFLRGKIGGQRAVLHYKDLSNLNFHNHDISQADFTGSMLVEADLSLGIYKSACFFGCNLKSADLSYADLSRADLRGSYLGGANLSGACLIDADMREGKIMEKEKGGGLVNRKRTAGKGTKTILTGAHLANADLSSVRAHGADFSDADLSKAVIHSADFSKAHFEGANLNKTDFTGSDISHTNMRHAILSGMVLDGCEHFGIDKKHSITDDVLGEKIEDTGQTLAELLDNHTLWIRTTGKQGKKLNLSGYDLRDISDLRVHPLTAIEAVDTSFLSLDLSNVEMQSATLDRSDFRDCYMENADLRGSSLKNVKMTRANLCGVQFSPLQLKTENKTERLHRVDLSGADLRFSNLQNADLRDSILMGIDLTGADLTGADLRRADLTGALIKNACLDDVKLDKAIIDLGTV